MRAAAVALALSAGCALPVVSAGTFLPAGELKPGDLHASVSLESGRVLAGPDDVRGPNDPAPPPDATRYEVSTWVAADASLRWQLNSRLSLEGQLKFTDPVVPFTPEAVGGAIGARVRLADQGAGNAPSIELGVRAVGIRVDQEITRTRPTGESQTDRWYYRAWGLELPLVVSYRVNPLFTVTGAPFTRIYWIRAWHSVGVDPVPQPPDAVLQWAPILSGGLGLSCAVDLGPVEIAPGVAVEIATRPGPGAATQVLFEPGISLGTRW